MNLLEVEGLCKRFGGVQATKDVGFAVRQGEILGVVGPNGAGKSTLFDLLSGFTRPDQGKVCFRGHSVVGWRPDQISRLGMGRTFQKLKPFPSMSVLENVMVGALQKAETMREAREKALLVLQQVGIYEKRGHYAAMLSTGQRKRLELARALATSPQLLLLDEVSGGVDMRGIPALMTLIEQLREAGLTFLVIEHNMPLLMSLADRVLALHLGQLIVQGTPQEVQQNPQVIASYLGGAYASN